MAITRERTIAESRNHTRWKALLIPRFLICQTLKSAGKHRRYSKKKDFFFKNRDFRFRKKMCKSLHYARNATFVAPEVEKSVSSPGFEPVPYVSPHYCVTICIISRGTIWTGVALSLRYFSKTGDLYR